MLQEGAFISPRGFIINECKLDELKQHNFVFFFSVQEVRTPKSRGQQGCFLLEGDSEGKMSPRFPLNGWKSISRLLLGFLIILKVLWRTTEVASERQAWCAVDTRKYCSSNSSAALFNFAKNALLLLVTQVFRGLG